MSEWCGKWLLLSEYPVLLLFPPPLYDQMDICHIPGGGAGFTLSGTTLVHISKMSIIPFSETFIIIIKQWYVTIIQSEYNAIHIIQNYVVILDIWVIITWNVPDRSSWVVGDLFNHN